MPGSQSKREINICKEYLRLIIDSVSPGSRWIASISAHRRTGEPVW
jgi:hypothetical protein